MQDMIWSPLAIRGVTLENRLVMTALTLFYSPDRRLNERYERFWERRAEGGVGAIVVGPTGVDMVGSGWMTLGLDTDEVVGDWARLADRLHAHGCKAIAQLFHSGRYAMSMVTGEQPIGPSAVRSDFSKETPREMSLEDIDAVQESFAKAAGRAREAGLDGVEILGSAGYLVSQFLSPVTNLRTDEYGGSFEARVRFGREIVERVRAAAGDSMIVGMRVAGNDFVAGSNDSGDSARACRAFADAGVDLFDVTGGWHETRVPQLTMEVPQGAYAYLARTIREATHKPVIASNRLGNPHVAESTLRDGFADLVGLARPLLADPDWPRKVREGRNDEIAPCIACMEGCMDRLVSGRAVTCTMNPLAGEEPPAGEEDAAGEKRKVIVVGGGPAGMQAALVAARRGHEVHLHEATDRLGGQLDMAAVVPGRSELDSITPYYASALAEAAVRIRLESRLGAGDIEREAPDHVILAAGARPLDAPIPGADGPNVIQAWDLLRDDVPTGSRVAVIGGGAVGLDAALYLSARGTLDPETLAFLMFHRAEKDEHLHALLERGSKTVTVFEKETRTGRDLGRSSRWVLLGELERRGVTILPGHEITGIAADGTVTWVRRKADKTTEEGRTLFDTVVVALGAAPVDDGLAADLEAKGIAHTVVGDGAKPGRLIDAIHAANAAARKI